MAKRKAAKSEGGVNKSKAIREALKNNPSASPKDIATELTSQGLVVSPAYVSIIRSASKKKRGGKRKARVASPRADVVVASDLLEAKKLVDRVGGIEQVETLLGTLKRLQ